MGQDIEFNKYHDQKVSHFIISVFHSWRKARIPFVVLRNYKGLPGYIGNDLDILVEERELKHAEHILIYCAIKCGFRFYNRVDFSAVSLFYYHAASRTQLHIDLFTDLQWRGFNIINYHDVFENCMDKGLFYAPHPIHEAVINLLTRLLYHGYVKENYKTGIHETFRVNQALSESVLAASFGNDLARKIVQDVLAYNWQAIEARTNVLRSKLILRQMAIAPLGTFRSLISNVRRLLWRFGARSPGLFVAFVGPDGCGKSSIADGLMSNLERTFSREKSLHSHWKPSVLKPGKKNVTSVTNPHLKPVRGRWVSLSFFTFHVMDFILSGALRLRPTLFRNGLALVDRYYYDFFVDQKRYRLNLPNWIIHLGYCFVMKPNLVLLLDAPVEMLHERKQEVPLEETGRQRDAYLKLIQSLPNGYVVDASKPLQEVIRQVEDIVIDYMAKRTARRLGLE